MHNRVLALHGSAKLAPIIYGTPNQDGAHVFTVHILGISGIPLYDTDNHDVLWDVGFPTLHRKHGHRTVSVNGC